jgi:penicillin-binding protein 2
LDLNFWIFKPVRRKIMFEGEFYTEKRFIAVFTAFTLIIGCLCLRMYVVCSKGTEYVSSQSHYYSLQIGSIRGEIYDCNGEKLVDTDYDNVVAAKPTLTALNALENVLDTEDYSQIKKRMEKSNAVSVNIGKLEIEQNSDAIMLRAYKRYSEAQIAQHIIGYVNSDGNGVSGIENCYNEYLYTGKSLTARFSSDAYGRVISGESIEILNGNLSTGSVYLTIDSEFQKAVEDSLDMCDVKQGGAVILDAKSGAILAMASRPIYNANNIAENINAADSPLVNRALQAYAAGSIFKVAVAAAAIENGITDFEYDCTGSCNVDGITFHCNKSKAHGKLNMEKALEYSCNSYFIQLAQKIGAKKLLETVNQLGFGQEIRLTDTLVSKAGALPEEKELTSSGALANFSFGQGNFTTTMLQLGEMMTAVANGGKYTTPYLVNKVMNSDGKIVFQHEKTYPVIALKKSTSSVLTSMLESVVEKGNAVKAKLKNEVRAAGKTATAQTGTFDAYGTEICNTWFGGFFPVDNPKYVVIILKQGGSSGAEDCAPVFKKTADKIYDICEKRQDFQ